MANFVKKNYRNFVNELLKIRLSSIKDLMNKFCVLNGEKYFSSEIFQNYLVCIPAKKIH